MFERFTDRARRVVVLAREEAGMLNHHYIGTEHLLLGLIHEGEGVAAIALESLHISLDRARSLIEDIIGRGEATPTGHVPFTPRAKKVLELSLREARQLGHDYIGTEHILLGLIREGEGIAAQVLHKLGADLGRARARVIEILSGYVPLIEDRDAGSSMGHAPLMDDARIPSPIDPALQEVEEKILQVRALKSWAVDLRYFEVAATMREAERLLREATDTSRRHGEGPGETSSEPRDT